MLLNPPAAAETTELLSLELPENSDAFAVGASVVIPELSGTVVSRGRPIHLASGAPLFQADTQYGAANVSIFEDVGDNGSWVEIGRRFTGYALAAMGFIQGVELSARSAPQPEGTIIRYETRIQGVNAGTVWAYGVAESPIFLRAHEV